MTAGGEGAWGLGEKGDRMGALHLFGPWTSGSFAGAALRSSNKREVGGGLLGGGVTEAAVGRRGLARGRGLGPPEPPLPLTPSGGLHVLCLGPSVLPAAAPCSRARPGPPATAP